MLRLRVVWLCVCYVNDRSGSSPSITICLRSAADAPHQQFGNTETVSLKAAVVFPREVLRARAARCIRRACVCPCSKHGARSAVGCAARGAGDVRKCEVTAVDRGPQRAHHRVDIKQHVPITACVPLVYALCAYACALCACVATPDGFRLLPVTLSTAAAESARSCRRRRVAGSTPVLAGPDPTAQSSPPCRE